VADVRIRRIDGGPALVIEAAERTRVERRGGFLVVSSKDTEYTVLAQVVKGRKALVAKLPNVAIYVHEDCFGDDFTCQGVRAGGIYNGHPSIWDC
jgi:hypothetical protein